MKAVGGRRAIAASEKTVQTGGDACAASRRVRLVVFVTLAAFITLGPFYRQVLQRKSPYLRPWMMFQSVGRNICQVHYFRKLPDGRAVVVDRFALLEVARPPAAPEDVWKVEKAEGAVALGRRLCERLPEGERDLRLVARCGTEAGWQAVSDGTRNLCAAEAAPPTEPRP